MQVCHFGTFSPANRSLRFCKGGICSFADIRSSMQLSIMNLFTLQPYGLEYFRAHQAPARHLCRLSIRHMCMGLALYQLVLQASVVAKEEKV